MTREHAGFICTVYRIAYGHYRYICTNAFGTPLDGTVEANDEAEAMDKVFQIIDKVKE
jgi:hypothetical protein